MLERYKGKLPKYYMRPLIDMQPMLLISIALSAHIIFIGREAVDGLFCPFLSKVASSTGILFVIHATPFYK
jgi:hypothetical protein